jgi:CRP/FNR family cyclic AMP-dependent transcriptional regulator
MGIPPGDDEILECLRRAPLFQGLAAEDLRRLSRSFVRKRVEKGYVVFMEGDSADELYVVMGGSVLEHVTGPNELEIPVKERLPGDYFGEMGMLLGEPQFVTAIATQPTSLALLPKKEFLALVRSEPSMSLFLLKTLAHRLRQAAEFGIAYAYLDAYARLAYVILGLEEDEGGSGSIKHSQEELAQRCGLARQTVARILGEWRDAGWLRTSRGRIEGIDRLALKQIVSMSHASRK